MSIDYRKLPKGMIFDVENNNLFYKKKNLKNKIWGKGHFRNEPRIVNKRNKHRRRKKKC